MKFLVDAQLPFRWVDRLVAAGHQAVHTRKLPSGNRITDDQVTAIADRDGCVVITKDSDFATSHCLLGRPRKLWLITTGNLPNESLFHLIDGNLRAIVAMFAEHDFVELGFSTLIVHD